MKTTLLKSEGWSKIKQTDMPNTLGPEYDMVLGLSQQHPMYKKGHLVSGCENKFIEINYHTVYNS